MTKINKNEIYKKKTKNKENIVINILFSQVMIN